MKSNFFSMFFSLENQNIFQQHLRNFVSSSHGSSLVSYQTGRLEVGGLNPGKGETIKVEFEWRLCRVYAVGALIYSCGGGY